MKRKQNFKNLLAKVLTIGAVSTLLTLPITTFGADLKIGEISQAPSVHGYWHFKFSESSPKTLAISLVDTTFRDEYVVGINILSKSDPNAPTILGNRENTYMSDSNIKRSIEWGRRKGKGDWVLHTNQTPYKEEDWKHYISMIDGMYPSNILTTVRLDFGDLSGFPSYFLAGWYKNALSSNSDVYNTQLQNFCYSGYEIVGSARGNDLSYGSSASITCSKVPVNPRVVIVTHRYNHTGPGIYEYDLPSPPLNLSSLYDAINNALKGVHGITPEQVKSIVDNAVANKATKQDVEQIINVAVSTLDNKLNGKTQELINYINNAISNLATKGDLNNVKNELINTINNNMNKNDEKLDNINNSLTNTINNNMNETNNKLNEMNKEINDNINQKFDDLPKPVIMTARKEYNKSNNTVSIKLKCEGRDFSYLTTPYGEVITNDSGNTLDGFTTISNTISITAKTNGSYQFIAYNKAGDCFVTDVVVTEIVPTPELTATLVDKLKAYSFDKNSNSKLKVNFDITSPKLYFSQEFELYAVLTDTSTGNKEELFLDDIVMRDNEPHKFIKEVDLSDFNIRNSTSDKYVLSFYLKHSDVECVKTVPTPTELTITTKAPILTLTSDNDPTQVNSEANVTISFKSDYGIKSLKYVVTPSSVPPIDDTNWMEVPNNFVKTLSGITGEVFVHAKGTDLSGQTVTKTLGLNLYHNYTPSLNSLTTPIYQSTSAGSPKLILSDNNSNRLNLTVTAMGELASKNRQLTVDLLGTGDRLLGTVTGNGTNLTSGVNISTDKEIEFVPLKLELKDEKSNTLNLPETLKNLPIYTIVNPIKQLFDIKMSKDETQFQLKIEQKPNSELVSKVFADDTGTTLADLITSPIGGLDLLNDMVIKISDKPCSIHDSMGVVQVGSLASSQTISFPTTNEDCYIALGYLNNTGVSYESKFTYDTIRGQVEIINVPEATVTTTTDYPIQLRVSSKDDVFLAPTTNPTYQANYPIEIMCIPVGSDGVRAYDITKPLSQVWSEASSIYSSEVKDFYSNNKLDTSGKYDIFVKAVNPYGGVNYDYKVLQLAVMKNDNYLAIENSENILVSKSTVYDKIRNKVTNHSLGTATAGDVGGYLLPNGDILLYNKETTGSGSVLEVYNDKLERTHSMDSSTVSHINCIFEYGGQILLGTSTGIYSMSEDYNTITPLAITDYANNTANIYCIAIYGDTLLFGTSDSNETLVQIKLDGLTWSRVGSKQSTDLFGDSSKKVKTILVKNSTIYLSPNENSTDATEFIILE